MWISPMKGCKRKISSFSVKVEAIVSMLGDVNIASPDRNLVLGPFSSGC